MYEVVLKNVPANVTVGRLFIQPYFFKCLIQPGLVKTVYFDGHIPHAKELHRALLQGNDIVIYKSRFKRGLPESVVLYLRYYHS
jgi:hypothetical protein